jgi:signal transduction histidine kinase
MSVTRLDAAAEQAARSLQGLRDLPEELAARLPQFIEAMVSVGTGLDLGRAMDRILETAVGLTGARYAAIGVINDEGDGLAEVVTYGAREERRGPVGGLPDGCEGLLAELVADPRPLRLADLSEERRAAGFPPGRPPMRSFLGVPIRVGEEVFGVLCLTEKAGGGDFSGCDLHTVQVLATAAGIQIGNARLCEATRRRERWIDGAAALTTSLLSGGADGALDDPLAVVAEQGRRLADAAAGLVLLPHEHGGLEIVRVASELPEPRDGLGAVLERSGPVLEQLLAGTPVFVADSASDPRMTIPSASRYGPSMLLPLKSEGRVLGTLALPRLRGEPPYTETDRVLAMQFAAQAALALVLAEAQRDRERLAVLEERDRIARDLHDLVIQRLFATGMMLEGAQRKAVIPEVHAGIGKAVDELDTTIQEIRAAIFALQQGSAEAPSGLLTRIESEINMAAVPLGFRPVTRYVGVVDARVGGLTGTNLLAALREALSNAFRHASASRIEVVVDATVSLPDGREGVRLTVSDDGTGIQDGRRRSGLSNLASRAESLGGSSTYGAGIGPAGAGTSVVWEAPL